MSNYNSILDRMKWIEIKDKLPEEEQKVFYYFEITGVSIGFYTRYAWSDEETNTFYSSSGWLTDDVTHWMPYTEGWMPKPP